MWGDAPWPQSRPWPTDWTENTVDARMSAYDPQQMVSSAFAWGAVVTIGREIQLRHQARALIVTIKQATS